MINFAIFSSSVLALFILIDVLQKKVFTKYAWSRKATHISSGLVILLFPSYLTVTQIVVMSVLFIAFLFVSKVRNILSIHNIKRFSWGEVYYPLSIGVLALICLPSNVNAFYAGLLSLALSDAVAEIAGELLPIVKFKFGNHQKSLGGSLGFFIVTFCIMGFLYFPLGASLIIILAIAIILTLVELVSFYGLDNLAVPILAALLAIWWL
jgi:phytol kinase